MGEHRRVAEFWSQLWSCYGHKILPKMWSSKEDNHRRMSQIATVERSPEKAGVGGSIPSLATIQNGVHPMQLFHGLSCFRATHPFLFLAGERAFSFARWDHFDWNLDSGVNPCSNYGAQERSKDKEP